MKKTWLITIRILLITLALILLGGALLGIVAAAQRSEPKQGDAEAQTAQNYAVSLPTQQMYLLYAAAQEGTLAFEVAAHRIRNQHSAEDEGRFWLPYTLHADVFSEVVRHCINHIVLPVSSDEVTVVPTEMAFRPDISRSSALGRVNLKVSEGNGGQPFAAVWYLYSDYTAVKTYPAIDEITTRNGMRVSLHSEDDLHYTPGNTAYAKIWGGTMHHTLQMATSEAGVPTYLEHCDVYPLSEIFETDEALAAEAQSELKAVRATVLGIWIYVGVAAAVLVALLTVFLIYRANINRERGTNKYLIALRVACVLLAVLLAVGALLVADMHRRREKRREYYATQEPVLSAGFDHYEETYYLWLWSDREMTLLQRAANKGALYYEIAADYVRHWQEREQGLDYVDFSWLPYELNYKTYGREVGVLLESIYLPVLPDGHEHTFEYNNISIYQKPVTMHDAKPPRISVGLIEKDKATGEQICSSSVSILFDSQAWQNMGVLLSASYTLYETLTTADGYEVKYYTYLDGHVANGSSWGEVCVDGEQVIQMPVALYRENGEYVGYDVLRSLSDSTLISYAEYLETNEALRESVSTQWRTITLVYYSVILYITLVSLLLVQLVVSVVMYGKTRARQKGSRS